MKDHWKGEKYVMLWMKTGKVKGDIVLNSKKL